MPTADLVLSRFPRHLDADVPGKLIGDVVSGLATGQDAAIGQVGRVRRSHRVGELDQVIDLLHLAGLHGFDASMLDALLRRVREIDPPIPYDRWLRIAARMLTDAIVDQREESGTVAGVLGAAAAYLGLDLVELDHDPGGYWYLARCVDRLLPGDDPGQPAEQLLALEENPQHVADVGPTPRHHGDRFAVLRQGFDPAPATVVVRGIEDRTLRPIVVNVDDGFGVATTLAVGNGATLRFERDGRVELDGASVAGRSFTFRGAVYADEARDHERDFVFDDATSSATSSATSPATFVVTQPPADAFDDHPTFPHADPLLPAVVLGRGETRFAVFVGAGVFGSEADDGAHTPVQAAPHPIAGIFDDTVFEPEPAPDGAPSFEIGLEWDEREAYAARVWLPRTTADLDRDGEAPMREVLRGLLDRHRAAGVHLYVEYTDPRWTLGTGIVRDLDSEDALGIVVAGTEAWEDDTEQPPPSGPDA